MSEADQPEKRVYQIKVQGKLPDRWSDWFNDMTLKYEIGSDGFLVTTLTGPVIDQAALHGILNKIRDLNVKLLSVTGLDPSDQ